LPNELVVEVLTTLDWRKRKEGGKENRGMQTI
jgi:hypothetical protein